MVSRQKMNLPNKLTVSRLGFSVFFVACFFLPFPGRYSVALGLFALASVTDYLDGVIARNRGLISDFGKLMDPLADKILTASAFICLIGISREGIPALPAWATIVIISREFLITGLRSLALTKGIVLPAEKLGKHKTLWQMITISYFLCLLAAGEWVSEPSGLLDRLWVIGAWGLVPLTVLLTVYSGLAYLAKHRHLIRID